MTCSCTVDAWKGLRATVVGHSVTGRLPLHPFEPLYHYGTMDMCASAILGVTVDDWPAWSMPPVGRLVGARVRGRNRPKSPRAARSPGDAGRGRSNAQARLQRSCATHSCATHSMLRIVVIRSCATCYVVVLRATGQARTRACVVPAASWPRAIPRRAERGRSNAQARLLKGVEGAAPRELHRAARVDSINIHITCNR